MATIPAVLIIYGFLEGLKNITGIAEKRKGKGAEVGRRKLRKLCRESHALLVKNMENEGIGEKDCGLMIYLMHGVSEWGAQGVSQKWFSTEENEWLRYDIQSYLSSELTVKQRIRMLSRMERYYLL